MSIVFNQGGLEQSIEATIKDRSGRVKISIFDINSILEDLTMQIIGGIRGSIDIWELAILPMLLNNCDTWVNINEELENKLENLQELFFRTILQVPISCPKPALLFETGTLKIQN